VEGRSASAYIKITFLSVGLLSSTGSLSSRRLKVEETAGRRVGVI